jgi:hypothetical protein
VKEPVKAFKTAVYSGPGVGGHKTLVEAATPAASLEEFFQFLMRQHGELEAPNFSGPTRPVSTARIK